MRTAAGLFILIVLSLCLLASSLTPLLPIDDSYISFRYARNWTEGQGLVYNTGERVEAYSNFLWTALLAVLAWLGVTPPLGARLLSWAALACCSLLMYWISRRRMPDAPVPFHLAAGLGLLCLPSTIFHTLSGMETVLTALLLLAFYWLVELDLHPRTHAVLLGIALASISIARPEGLLFSLLVVLAFGSLKLLDDPPHRVRLAVVLLSCAIPMAIFFGWRWFYYGTLLPNSVSAKSAGLQINALTGGIDYLRRFLVFYSPLVLLAAISLIRARRTEILVFRVPALATFLAVTLLGGFADGYPYTRYLFPLIPLLLVWTIEGVWFICVTATTSRGPSFGFLFSLCLMSSLLLVQTFLSFSEYRLSGLPFYSSGLTARPTKTLRAFFAQDSVAHPADGPLREGLGHHELSGWLKRHASQDDLLATYEIGIVPYYSRIRVLDLFGLADRRIATSPGFPGARVDLNYAFGRTPKYVAYRAPSDCLCSYYPVFRSPEFRDWYDLVAVFPYWTTKWLLFQRRAVPVSSSRQWLGWDHSSDRPVTEGGQAAGHAIGVRMEGQVMLDPHLQLLAPLQKENLFFQILSHPESEGGRDAMREWMDTFQKAFVFGPAEDESPARLDYDLVIPPNTLLEFSFAAVTRNSAFDSQQFQVSAQTAGQSQILFSRDFRTPADLKPGWEKMRVDLSQFAGQRVKLFFSRSKSRQPLSMAIGEPRIVGNIQAGSVVRTD